MKEDGKSEAFDMYGKGFEGPTPLGYDAVSLGWYFPKKCIKNSI
jgi:hypothetical protein